MKLRRYVNRRTVSRILGPRIANSLADRFPYQRPGVPPIDVAGFYRFIDMEDFGAPIAAGSPPEARTLNWFIPAVGRESGGHRTIFRFVHNLEAMGFRCRIIVCDTQNPFPAAEIKANINAWFFPLKADVHVLTGSESLPPAEIAIATGWQTAYPVRRFRSTLRKAYFVQDFEPSFYPVGSESAFAENTYRFGFAGITAGNWLEEKLAADYGMATRAFGFSYDQDLYKPRPEAAERNGRTVFVYVRPVTPRRGFELTILALKRLAARLDGLKVIFAGWDIGNYHIPFSHENHGAVRPEVLPILYNRSDAALVVSLTNLSLLPLEVMACDCPVVSNRGANVEWLLNDDNAELADATVEGLAEALERVLTDKARRQSLIENGRLTTRGTDWQKEAEKVAGFLGELAA